MKNTLKKIGVMTLLGIFTLGVVTPASAQTMAEKNKEVRASYAQARDQYKKEVEAFKSTRQEYLNVKAKYEQYKTADNKKALEDETRAFLEKTATGLVSRLESIRAWVSGNQAISDADQQTIIAEINDDIAWLNDRIPKIQSASGDAIKAQAKEMQTYWGSHQKDVKRIVGEVMLARVNYVINQADMFAAKASTKIAEAKAAGKDTTKWEQELANFNAKLGLAKEKYNQAHDIFVSIKSDSSTDMKTINDLFVKGNAFVKDANTYLKDAYHQVVTLAKEVK